MRKVLDVCSECATRFKIGDKIWSHEQDPNFCPCCDDKPSREITLEAKSVGDNILEITSINPTPGLLFDGIKNESLLLVIPGEEVLGVFERSHGRHFSPSTILAKAKTHEKEDYGE